MPQAHGPRGWARGLIPACNPRFRVEQRRTVGEASLRAFALSGAGIAFYALFGVGFHPHAAGVVASVSAVLVVYATLAYGIVRRRPKWAARLLFVELVAVDAGMFATAWTDPDFVIGALAILLLVAPALPLIVPWPLPVHATFMAGHTVAILGFIAASSDAWISGGERPLLIAVALGSVLVGMAGHITNLRDRLERFEQLEHIRLLRRTTRRQNELLEQLNRDLERAARTDELTGLPNRVALRRELLAMRSSIDRRGRKYALLVLDLDRFKAVNDSLGHLAGDDVLRRIGVTIQGLIRPSDHAFRFGGEEFLVIGEVQAGRDALGLAERIRTGVADLGIDHPGNPPFGRVTVSIGATVVDLHDVAGTDSTWLARADRALYEAKAAGRNRTVMDRRAASPVRPDPGSGRILVG